MNIFSLILSSFCFIAYIIYSSCFIFCRFMTISGHTYGRPIAGQKEVCAISYSDSNCYWKTAEGVFIKPSDPPKAAIGHIHSEL